MYFEKILQSAFLIKIVLLASFMITILTAAAVYSQSITDNRTSVTFNENTLNSTAQFLYPSGTTSYSSANTSFTTLRVQYLDGSGNPIATGLAEDILFINEEGTSSGEVNIVLGDPNTIRVGTISVGTFPSSLTGSGVNGEFLEITWNSNATETFINDVLNNITYQNSSNTPTASRDVRLSITDNEVTATSDLTINVTAENDAPDMGLTGTDKTDITEPGDPIDGWPQPYSVGSSGCTSCSPSSEQVENAIDNSSNSKYLNFGKEGTGYEITPSAGPTIVTQLTFTSANDSPERDPITYTLEGSKDGGSSYTTIVSDANTNLTTDRFNKTEAAEFSNSEWYSTYRLTFPTIRNTSTAVAMQIAETELLGIPFQRTVFAVGESLDPVIVYPQLPVSDPDSPNLQSATVTITTNLASGNDVLSWDNTLASNAGISGSYNSSTGILSFTGSATVSEYRDLLRSVTFFTDTNATGKERLIEFQVTDDEGGNSLTSGTAEATLIASFRPTLDNINTLETVTVNKATTITHSELETASVNLSDGDTEDIPLSFIVKSVAGNGSLTKSGTAVSSGTIIEPGQQVTWTPTTSGTDITAFSVRAYDGDLESNTTVDVQMNVFTVQLQSTAGSITSLTDYNGLSAARNKINDGTHQGDITITLNGDEPIVSAFEIEESGTVGSSSYNSLLIDISGTGSISVNSGGTFTLNDSQRLRVNGSFTVSSGQSAILNSGSVVEVPGGGTVTNNGTIDVKSGAFFNNQSSSNPSLDLKRNFDNGEGWRYISSPVNTTLKTLLDPIWTQGSGITGVDAAFGTPNVYRWGNVAGNNRSDWVAVSDHTQSISAGDGFLVFVYADDDFNGSADPFPKTLSISGQEFSPYSVQTNTAANDGWTLIGNSFVTAVDYDDLLPGDGSVTNAVYVWQPIATDGDGGNDQPTNSTGSWRTYNASNGTGDLTDGLIAPFQAFFVQNSGSAGNTINADNTVKSNNVSNTEFLFKDSNRSRIRLELTGENNNLFDSAWITTSPAGSNDTRSPGDALQLDPMSTSYALLASQKEDGTETDIGQFVLHESEETQIPLITEATENGSYTLSVTRMEGHSQVEFYLVDTVKDRRIKLDSETSYTFDLENKAKSVSQNPFDLLQSNPVRTRKSSDNRFFITAVPAGLAEAPDETPGSFKLQQNYPNPFNPVTQISFDVPRESNVKIDLYDLTGRHISTLVNDSFRSGSHTISFDGSDLSSGIYLYRMRSAGFLSTKKLTLIK